MGRMAYSEAEYSIAIKEIDRYVEFLVKSIGEYIEILDFLLEKAIGDDAIKAKILKLKGNISLYPSQMADIQKELAESLSAFTQQLDEADKIVLPEKEITIFEKFLQAFK